MTIAEKDGQPRSTVKTEHVKYRIIVRVFARIVVLSTAINIIVSLRLIFNFQTKLMEKAEIFDCSILIGISINRLNEVSCSVRI